MFRIHYYVLILIPAGAATTAHAALFVGGAGNFARVASNARHGNAEAIGRAIWQWTIYHVSGQPNVEVIREAAMLFLVGCDRAYSLVGSQWRTSGVKRQTCAMRSKCSRD